MKKKLDQTPTLYQKEKAIEIARMMNESDDWEYRPKHDPTGQGYSLIEIYDETGEYVGCL